MLKRKPHETRVRDSRQLVADILKYLILIVGVFVMIFPFLRIA